MRRTEGRCAYELKDRIAWCCPPPPADVIPFLDADTATGRGFIVPAHEAVVRS